jgi:DNA-binding CsgD family transcriptional regulator
VLHYAAEHPDEVTHLIALPPDYPVMTSPEGDNLKGLAREDWETFTETLAHVAMGWDRSDRARALSAHWRETVSQATYLEFLDQFRWPSLDEVAALRGRITAPVLVVARRHRYLTTRIPAMSATLDSRVVLLPGQDALPYEGDTERIIDVMSRFVSEPQAVSEEASVPIEVEEDLPAGRQLTLREREVLDLLAQGKSNGEIADELVISVRTVERHLMRIYGKFGVSGKSARVIAAAHAILQAT